MTIRESRARLVEVEEGDHTGNTKHLIQATAMLPEAHAEVGLLDGPS